MKTLLILGGPLEMGRLEIEDSLRQILPRAAFLDGDRLWHYGRENVHHYDQRSDGALIIGTLMNMLRGYLENPAYDTIVFGWGMHLSETHHQVLNVFHSADISELPRQIVNVSLICDEETVLVKTRERLLAERGIWDKICDLELQTLSFRTMNRLKCYEKLDTRKVDISRKTAEETAKEITALL